MAASVDELLEEVKCYACLGLPLADLLQLALLNRIADGGVGGAAVYRAIISQSGTDEPVATVLQNTIGNIVWSRVNQGEYRATLANAFTSGKTAVIINASSGSGGVLRGIGVATVNEIVAYTSLGGSLEDSLLSDTYVEILVYP